MKTLRVLVAAVSILVAAFILFRSFTTPPGGPAPRAGDLAGDGPVILRASRVLDGAGALLEARDVVIDEGRIVSIVPRGEGSGRVYDLAVTVSPAGPVRGGTAPAEGTVFLGTDRAGSVAEPGLNVLRYAG